jgi:hypothetical protein
MLSGEATNTNLIVFGLTRSGLEVNMHHYTINVVKELENT